MSSKLTRREAALALGGSAFVAAQAPNAPPPPNPDEELKAAREAIQRNLKQLDQFPMPMATEPATHFRA